VHRRAGTKLKFLTIVHELPLAREFGFCGCASGQGIAKLDHCARWQSGVARV